MNAIVSLYRMMLALGSVSSIATTVYLAPVAGSRSMSLVSRYGVGVLRGKREPCRVETKSVLHIIMCISISSIKSHS